MSSELRLHCLWEENGDCNLADPRCPRSGVIIYRKRVTIPPDHHLDLCRGRDHGIDHRIRASWMSFNRYRKELYDRITVSLELKIQMVKYEVLEPLLYGCVAGTPLKGDYRKRRAAHHRILLPILGVGRGTTEPSDRIPPSNRLTVRGLKPQCPRGYYCGRGHSF